MWETKHDYSANGEAYVQTQPLPHTYISACTNTLSVQLGKYLSMGSKNTQYCGARLTKLLGRQLNQTGRC